MKDAGSITPEVKSIFDRIVLEPSAVELLINRKAMRNLLQITDATATVETELPLKINVPIQIKRSGRPRRILISSLDLGDQSQLINESMVKAIGRAHRWDKEFRLGKSMSEIAKADNVHRSYIGQVLPLAFLAPDIVEAILDGRQPQDLKVEQLLKALPIEWDAQRRTLGFSVQ